MSWYRITRKFKHKPKAVQYQFVEEPTEKIPEEPVSAPETTTKIEPESVLPPAQPEAIQKNLPQPIGSTAPTDEGIKKLEFVRKKQEARLFRNNLLDLVHVDINNLQQANSQIQLWNQSNPDIQIPIISLEDTQIVNFRKNLVAQTKEQIDAKIPGENATREQTSKAFNAIQKLLRNANVEIDNFNKNNPSTPVAYLDWKEFPELTKPESGVMNYFLIPFSNQGSEQEDTNTSFIVEKIKDVFTNYGITDDKAGAELLAILASDEEHPDVRLLVNEYFTKSGRKNLHKIIELAGFENLAEEFKKIPDKDLQYKRPYDMEVPDEIFGEDYGLTTRSEAERQILAIFRGLDLQPVPVEIKMPSTKVRQGTTEVNTEFMCDFLLPCDVLQMTTDESGRSIPKIIPQVKFIGEYLGFYSLKPKTEKSDQPVDRETAKRNKIIEDYEKKTELKTMLQPMQTFIAGGDVIYISKDDFESGGNAYKLIYQLEQKNIIFRGSKASEELENWKKDPNGGLSASQELLNEVNNSMQKMSPELSIVRSAMVQLQFKFGELGKFFQNYSDPENSNFRDLVQSYYNQYAAPRKDENGNELPSLQQEQFRLNQAMRALTYRVSADMQKEAKEEFEKAKAKIKGKISDLTLNRMEIQAKQRVYAKYYNWQNIAGSKRGEEFQDLMRQLQDISSQVRKIYSGHSSEDPNALTATAIRKRHEEALLNSTDDQGYQPRLSELKTLESCLEQPQQSSCSFMPEDPKQKASFVSSVCENVFSGLKVALIRKTKNQPSVFVPMLPKLAVALNKYKKLITACNVDIFFNPKNRK